MAAFLCVTTATCGDATSPAETPSGEDPPGGDGEAPVGEPLLFVEWFELRPRALLAQGGETVTLTVRTARPVDSVRVVVQGEVVGLTDHGGGVHQAQLASDQLLAHYEAGELKASAGLFQALVDGAWHSGGRFQVNALEGGSVPVRALAPDAQASERVLNLREDAPLLSEENVPERTLARAATLLPDHFDFLAIVAPVSQLANRFFVHLQNDDEGLGLPSGFRSEVLDGLPGLQNLEGWVAFPNDGFFEPAGRGMNHELGHRWMVFIDHPLMGTAGSHWPPSTLATGAMGWAAGGQGLFFPGRLEPVGEGAVRVDCSDPALALDFNDMELYLMGLLPADSVGEHLVLTSTERFECGAEETTAPFDVGDVIARHGPRVPDWQTASREYRLAVVVLSRGRLLDDREMAYFEHLVRRAESEEPVLGREGLVGGIIHPFHVATGGRASLSTVLFP